MLVIHNTHNVPKNHAKYKLVEFEYFKSTYSNSTLLFSINYGLFKINMYTIVFICDQFKVCI